MSSEEVERAIEWARGFDGVLISEHPWVGPFDVLAAEVRRLRSELALALAAVEDSDQVLQEERESCLRMTAYAKEWKERAEKAEARVKELEIAEAKRQHEIAAVLLGGESKLEKAERELAECRKECEEQARLNGMGGSRELALRAQVSKLRHALVVGGQELAMDALIATDPPLSPKPCAEAKAHDEDCPCYGDKVEHTEDCANCECQKPHESGRCQRIMRSMCDTCAPQSSPPYDCPVCYWYDEDGRRVSFYAPAPRQPPKPKLVDGMIEGKCGLEACECADPKPSGSELRDHAYDPTCACCVPPGTAWPKPDEGKR